MATMNAVAPKTSGISLVDLQAQQAQMAAEMKDLIAAIKGGSVATPSAKPEPIATPAPKPVLESKSKGKTVHTSPSAKEIGVENHWGDSIAEARIIAGKLLLTLSLPTGGSVSASGKSTVHQSGAVVLSDGSKLTFSRFTKL